ncbi:hypothetical protein ACN9MU_02680 [Pseudoduganella sp. R-32]|uniref:hypothetical protein n=1 Tax=Pseudoduganella sp. R-32 TaxID=3404061 RepID=UPI003CF036B7
MPELRGATECIERGGVSLSAALDKGAAIEILLAARRIADQAKEEGALRSPKVPRATCDHMGGVLADSVLQSGLNYKTVVRPRVMAILQTYPKVDTVSALVKLTQRRKTAEFLNWNHHEKVTRFESLVSFMKDWGIEDAEDLRSALNDADFCNAMQSINGIGPKTVDYMACLVGIDSIAIDRHVRTFAKKVGVESSDYQFLKRSFCCAADLLSLPRREFDAWLWRNATFPMPKQLNLAL